jgi:GAF domain-containing protein
VFVTADNLATTLHELATVLQTQRTLGGALAGIAEAATVSVPGCDAATIAISVEGRPATAAITARVALELDMVQYEVGEGPCLTSFDAMETIRLDVAGPEEAFPHFAAAARAKGVRAVLSVPATWGGEVVATLNLYSRTRPFDESGVSVAAVLAAQVAIAVSRSPEFAAARAFVEEAQRNADDSAQVNLATGLLMVNQECTSEQAAGLLNEAAAHDEQSILEIAQRIINEQRTGR